VVAGDKIKSLSNTHKKIRKRKTFPDFYTMTGSFNRSLTDRHYVIVGSFYCACDDMTPELPPVFSYLWRLFQRLTG
ncbi:hypothetical protein, partial [Pectobacterium betavasculorum]|uniref:hypothetical protein n=1 Tax=Pectobacterium betavasculorum TaxID=55207 RepID=UPI001E62A759